MEAIAALHNRVSQSALVAPAPAGAILDNIKRAALRAADHAMLRPWRFLVIEGEGLQRLGELFVRAREAREGELSPRERERTLGRPLRAPLLIVVVAACRTNTKVPAVEQLLSAGAAMQNMLNAAYAEGVGAMWRTGDFAYDPVVKAGLGVAETEHIIGFLYLGTASEQRPRTPPPDPAQFFVSWGNDR
ncbi:MAG: nitroreductase family protein [Gammaproteobacteria bacterium]|nr:nitroreductase family protein [Gammaproteobacteria bacterium]